MAKPNKMSHYVLQTHTPKKLAAWYAALLGAEVVFESPFVTLVTYDEEHHRIAFAPLPPDADVRRADFKPGLSHVAFGYESLANLLECFAAAKARGDRPVVSIHHGMTISLYYKDPDGNNVETFVECFSTPQGAMDFMRSPAFVKNSVGQPFDADAALAGLQAGASEKELMSYDCEAEVDVHALGMQTLAALG